MRFGGARNRRCVLKSMQNKLLTLALILSAGCASLPRGEPVPGNRAAQVAEQYASRQPAHFEALHTVLLAIKPHWWWPTIRQVTLGCSRIDRTTRSYEVTCFSPLGMKLFNISCTNGNISGTLLLPGNGTQERWVQSIGAAISNAYLDLTPGPATSAVQRGDRLILSCASGKLRTDYTFSGTNAFLTSKEYFDGNKRTMTITYDDYQTTANRTVPNRMSLCDHRNGYRLLFILKEFRDLTENPSSN